VIEPFTGVTLEIGGGVETYWKSTAAPAPPKALGGTSAATSPSNYGMSPGGGGLAATVSSVVGAYVHAVVQLTRDRRPVVCTGRRLPEDAVELGVGDATLAQVEAIAQRQGKWLEFWPVGQAALPQDHMLTLDTLLKVGSAAPGQWKSSTDNPCRSYHRRWACASSSRCARPQRTSSGRSRQRP
jgi:hypothetical protein